MSKIKTKSGAAKRFKKTADGLECEHAFKSHILTKMTTKRKRRLRGTSMLDKPDVTRVEHSLRLRW